MIVAVVGAVFFALTYKRPTCFDGGQNGDELGVDCGGSCERLCPFEVAPLRVLWSRTFEVSSGIYNAVAYVENPNQHAGIRALKYVFRLFDATGKELLERAGTTFITPNGISPIFESDLRTGGGVPARTFFEFVEEPEWYRGRSLGQALSVEGTRLIDTATRPRIDATLLNTTLGDFRDVEVVGVVFASDGNAIATSRTVVPLVEGGSSRSLVFTWPRPYEKRLERCAVPSDVALVLDVSGSMNDVGDNPPQPITDTKTAAASFVSRLEEADRVAVVTFAGEGTVLQELTSGHERARSLVEAITISPLDEVGRKTNIAQGLEVSENTLLSKTRDGEYSRVMVLLTDGRANVPSESSAEATSLALAGQIKQSGISLYVIGLGDDVNHSFLEQVATSKSYYYRAAQSEELESIYRQISTSICERGPAVIEITPRLKESLYLTPGS